MAASSLAARRAFAPVVSSTASSASCSHITLAPARPAALLARRAWLPTTTPRRRALLCRAADDEGQQQQQSPAEAAPPAASSSGGSGGAGSSQEQLKRPAVEDPSIAKGQRTAIITGAISIIFGVRVPVAGRAGAVHAPWSHGCPLLRCGRPPAGCTQQMHAIGTSLESHASLQSVLALGLQLHNATTAADQALYLPANAAPRPRPLPPASAPLALPSPGAALHPRQLTFPDLHIALPICCRSSTWRLCPSWTCGAASCCRRRPRPTCPEAPRQLPGAADCMAACMAAHTANQSLATYSSQLLRCASVPNERPCSL